MSNNKTYNSVLERPIIFIGNPRSGTSVISEIVMRHFDLAFPSQYQNRFPEHSNVNWLRILFDNQLWRVFGQKKQLNKVNPLNRYLFRATESYNMWNSIFNNRIDFGRGFLTDIELTNTEITKARYYFSKLVRKQGKKRLSFKITGPSRITFLNQIFPDAQYVLITRAPIPVISSLLKSGFWQELGAHRLWWQGSYDNEELKIIEKSKNDPILITALQIRKLNEVTSMEIDKIRPNLLRLSYEEFVSDPHSSVQLMLNFLNLGFDKACFNYLRNNQIHNRNQKKTDLFAPKDIEKISKILEFKR